MEKQKYTRLPFKMKVAAVSMVFAGLKQTDVAQQMGVSKTTLNKWTFDHDIALEAGRLLDKAKAAVIASKKAVIIEEDSLSKLIENDLSKWKALGEPKTIIGKAGRHYTEESLQRIRDGAKRRWENIPPKNRSVFFKKIRHAKKVDPQNPPKGYTWVKPYPRQPNGYFRKIRKDIATCGSALVLWSNNLTPEQRYERAVNASRASREKKRVA